MWAWLSPPTDLEYCCGRFCLPEWASTHLPALDQPISELQCTRIIFFTLSALLTAVLIVGKIIRARYVRSWWKQQVALQWEQQVDASPWRGKQFLVILNPNAGGGRAENIYQEFVRPMLKSAGVDVRVVRTTKPGDATALCAALRSRKFYVAESSKQRVDVVLCVSGDGMLHEALNGLADGGATALAPPCPALAICPAGSGNGVANSLLGRFAASNPFEAMFEILGGNLPSPMGANLSAPALPIDILAARALPLDAAVPPKYDLHYFCWGVFAEHDHLTEGPLRSLGPALKHALAPLIVLRRLTSFAGHADIEVVAPPPGLPYESAAALAPSPNDASLRRLHGPFWCFAVGNLRDGGNDSLPCPFVRRDEGAADLLVVKRDGLTRLRAARLLSLLDSGKHVHEPDVLVFKVRRVRLYPAAGTHVQLSGQEWSGGVAGGIEVSVKAQACRVVQPATAAAVEHRATGAVSTAKKVTTAAEWRAETAEVRAALLRAVAARR